MFTQMPVSGASIFSFGSGQESPNMYQCPHPLCGPNQKRGRPGHVGTAYQTDPDVEGLGQPLLAPLATPHVELLCAPQDPTTFFLHLGNGVKSMAFSIRVSPTRVKCSPHISFRRIM
ncbi:hypothetical protein KM043_016043 [Ampulex compressa]|nr:hypothetical protein KM043_016043 [Ampulex compressa]